MKAIGGYIELDKKEGAAYYPRAVALNTARNALVYLARARGIKKLYIPYYLCDSVSNVCLRESIDFAYYRTDGNLTPLFDGVLGEGEYLYLVNHYGQLSADTVAEMKKKHGRIIVDNVQAFFTPAVEGVDTLYSCRKYFGVPDGAYLLTDAPALSLDTDLSYGRMAHILGRLDTQDAGEFYPIFRANDAAFDDLPLRQMSRLTQTLLAGIDYGAVCARREENWAVLDAALGARNRLTLTMPKGPYMYPFYCKQGAEIRTALSKQSIFVPTLWPNVLTLDRGTAERDLAENILPLPIDQRYGAEEMQRILRALDALC